MNISRGYLEKDSFNYYDSNNFLILLIMYIQFTSFKYIYLYSILNNTM
jgi:hypothetical protein